MNWYAFISLILAGCALFLGNLVYGRNPQSKQNVLFMALSVSVALWGFIDYSYRQAGSEAAAALLIKLSFPSFFTISFALHFILAFTERYRLLAKKWLIGIIHAPAVFFAFMDLSTGMVSGNPVKGDWGWTYYPSANPAFFSLVAWGLVVSVIIVAACIHYYFAAHDQAKKQRALFGALGFALGAPIAYATAVLLPSLHIDFPPMVMPAYALVCALVGYGMWKHKLFALTPSSAAESIVNTMSDALLLVGMDRKIKLVNRAAARLLNYSEEELLAKTVDAIFPVDRAKSDPVFKEGSGFRGLVKAAIKGDVEAQLQAKSNRLVDVSLSGSLIRDTDNDLLGIVCIARDITERKSARDRLALSEARYRLLVENAPLGIISIDRDGTIRDVNASLSRMLGSPSIDATREINVLQYEPLIEAGIAGDLKRCLSEPGQLIGERRYTSKWDKTVYLRYYVNSICDETGHITGVQAIAEDITDAKAIEEALEQSKSELESRVETRTAELRVANSKLLEQVAERERAEKDLAAEKEQLAVTLRSIGDGVITTDTDARILLLNRVAESLTGVETQEAFGRKLSSVYSVAHFDGERGCLDPVSAVLASGDILESHTPITLVARDGFERQVEQSCAPIRNNQGDIIGAVLVFRDVTDKQRLEQELFRARKLESVGLLAGGIAHDFNNILTGIITNLFVAKMQIDAETETHGLITEAEKAAFKAGSLTKQLLAFSKDGVPVKSVHSVRAVIEDSIGFFLSGSNVDYVLDFAEDCDWEAEIDRGQIDQVLQSVISNADQAMPEGGTVTIRGQRVHIGDKAVLPLKQGCYIKVSVIDEGAGIAEHDLERIFDPYFTTREQGSGLGLAAAYAIVQKHDGHIRVESRKDEGATVSIYLPALTGGGGGRDESIGNEQREEPRTAEVRVLLMDDEEIVRVSGQKLLQSLGYRIDIAADGAQAVEAYETAMRAEDPFAVVILDLTVPGGMGARETIAQLRAVDPDVRAIACSGYSNDPMLQNFREHGFVDFIAKPYNISELNEKLSNATMKSPLS